MKTFQIGEIVFFSSQHRQRTLSGIIYTHFTNQPYKVIEWDLEDWRTRTIKNLKDTTQHFVFKDMIDKLISVADLRDEKLEKALS